MLSCCTFLKFHKKFMFKCCSSIMEVEPSWNPGLLCKVSEGFSRRMFKHSTSSSQFLFSEHLVLLFFFPNPPPCSVMMKLVLCLNIVLTINKELFQQLLWCEWIYFWVYLAVGMSFPWQARSPLLGWLVTPLSALAICGRLWGGHNKWLHWHLWWSWDQTVRLKHSRSWAA